MTTRIETLEQESFEKDDTFELPPPDIVAYNELRSCADLFRMYKQGILEIQPEYQREIVWKDADQTRFIDSLVKQLPIPSMCFSLDYKTQRWQIIDGLQRMWSIIRFLSGGEWTLSKLEDIDPKISGQPLRKFVDPKSDLHSYYTRVENLTLPITILRCDYSKTSHADYIFTIFHRLNSGGARLNNQEIRNCIYGGPFNKLLKELNANPKWMAINKMKETVGHRFVTEEIILRLFAFHDGYEAYTGRLSKYLNKYMRDHRSAEDSFLVSRRQIFSRTIDLVNGAIYEGKAPRKVRVSILEATLVGVSLNLDFVESQPAAAVKAMYEKLLTQDEFSDEKLKEGLSGKERVIDRMRVAQRVFSGN